MHRAAGRRHRPGRTPGRRLLGADVVSFHTERYRSNFVRACARLLGGSGIEVRGAEIVLPDGRVVETTSSPISIDAAEARGENGILVLSEFTGATGELPQAILCNPFDLEGLSYRIENGLCLPVEIRRAAIAEMAAHIQKHDVHRWVAEQLADIASRGAKLSRRAGTGTGAGAPGDR